MNGCGYADIEDWSREYLIERYKDLVEIEKEHKKENGELREIIAERETRLQEEINENCKLKTELYGNSISKDKIKQKMNKDINIIEHTVLGGRRNGKTLEYGIKLGRIQMCEELLEERN